MTSWSTPVDVLEAILEAGGGVTTGNGVAAKIAVAEGMIGIAVLVLSTKGRVANGGAVGGTRRGGENDSN